MPEDEFRKQKSCHLFLFSAAFWSILPKTITQGFAHRSQQYWWVSNTAWPLGGAGPKGFLPGDHPTSSTNPHARHRRRFLLVLSSGLIRSADGKEVMASSKNETRCPQKSRGETGGELGSAGPGGVTRPSVPSPVPSSSDNKN